MVLAQQVGQRDEVDRVHLVGVDDAAPRDGVRHQPSTGVTEKLLGGSQSSRQLAEHLDAGRVEPGLLLGLPERRLDRRLARVDRAAGEGDLAGVGAHVVRALGEQQPPVLEVVAGPSANSMQHRAAARVGVLGRQELGQVARW